MGLWIMIGWKIMECHKEYRGYELKMFALTQASSYKRLLIMTKLSFWCNERGIH